MRLNLNRDPEWVDLLPGVRVLAAPATSAVFGMVRRDPLIAGLGESPAEEEAAVAMAKAIAKIVIREWDGVEDDAGKPAAVTPDHVEALMDHYAIFEAWQVRYMARWLGLEAEKNASAPSPNGATAGAPNTARRVPAAAKTARKKPTLR